jgi:hypothetical protein
MGPNADEATAMNDAEHEGRAPNPLSRLKWVMRRFGIAIVFLATTPLLLLIVYRMAIVIAGYGMMDLWSSGKWRPVAAGARSLVEWGWLVVDCAGFLFPFCILGSLATLIAGFILKDAKLRLLGVTAIICSCLAGLLCLHTGAILMGL